MKRAVSCRNISVSHDARCFALTTTSKAGLCAELVPGSEPWQEAVSRGAFLPIALKGDRGGTAVRVLIQRDLSPQEEMEWVHRETATLDISDGRLVVCGSLDFLCEQYFPASDMVRTMSVPPGVYRLDLYSLYVGINGPAFSSAETNDAGTPL